MLETTLATSFVPGTNLKGNVAGANWSFLLPSLELEQIVCLGVPPVSTLKTLSRLSHEVRVVDYRSRQLWAISEISQRRGLSNVYPVAANHQAISRLPSRKADLVLIPSRSWMLKLKRDLALLVELQRLLKPTGWIYLEFNGATEWSPGREVMKVLGEGQGVTQVFWTTPLHGEVQTAVPLFDSETIRYFLRKKLYAPTTRLRVLDRAERFFYRHRLFSRFTRRYSALVGPLANELAVSPPEYLRTIAKRSGVDIDNHRWGLSARGKYNARKVVFFLLDRISGMPEFIVKMTRDPGLNPRVENEYRALTLLREKGIGDRETLPQVAFFGYHSKLAVLGQTAIDGVPFRQQAKTDPACAYVQQAIDWLTDLAEATANFGAATPVQAADELRKLFHQFAEIYRLEPAHYAFLDRQIATIEQCREAFPLVFQHGDPGIWNMMATSGGQVAFLDWEAAEPQGMPLWDLFYFLRSFCTWAAHDQGTRDSLTGFAQQFLGESPLHSLVIESTRRYCKRINLPAHLVEPLFYTCWVHRALKEVTRLTPARMERGFYVSLLRLCINQRSAPLFRQLFLEERGGTL